MSKLGSHDSFGHLQHKLWPKRKARNQTGNLTPDHEKSGINPIPLCAVTCDMSFERSQRELQLHFRPHPNQRYAQEVMVPQSCGSPNFSNFETPIWESQDKKSFGCDSYGEVQSILYGGRWWLPPSPCRSESCESKVACGLS
jgi:hypothetical protein